MSGISVLVPSFNHEPYVERTLRSIFSQSLLPSELIVIDDGSDDNSVETIERVLNESPINCRLISRENQGLPKTLNEGIAMCKGEFFAYLGSDDIWLPGFLKDRLALLHKHPDSCLAFGDGYTIDENDWIIGTPENTVDFEGSPLEFLRRGIVFQSPGVVYRRKLLPEKPWNEESALEDFDLYLRLAETSDFSFSRNSLSAWRVHGSNTSSNLPKLFAEFMKAHGAALERSSLDHDLKMSLTNKVWFEAGFNFIRQGYRKEAFEILAGNMSGADSIFRIFDLALRIAIPRRIFKWNQERKLERMRLKHGKIQDVGEGIVK
ncbi:MAG: glycosyltransferase [Pyrinomonadaceae bacterium]|nr:glycosyltransferase [Pyrinomonadaceae bacterium]